MNAIEGGLRVQREYNEIMQGVEVKSGMVLEERKLEIKFRKERVSEEIEKERIKMEAIEKEYRK